MCPGCVWWSGQCCHQIQIVIMRRRSGRGDPPPHPPPSTSPRRGHRPGIIHYRCLYFEALQDTRLQNIFPFLPVFNLLQLILLQFAYSLLQLQLASDCFSFLQFGSIWFSLHWEKAVLDFVDILTFTELTLVAKTSHLQGDQHQLWDSVTSF